MQEIYSVAEGNFGKVIVIEVTQDLVTHAHAQMQLSYWLGGGGSRCRVGDELIAFNEGMIALCNSYESHDMVLNSPSEPVIAMFLNIDLEWLDATDHGWKKPVQFSSSKIFSTTEIREASAVLMRKVLSLPALTDLCVETEVVKLLQLTLRQAEIMSPSVIPALRRRMPDYRLRLALTYMKENITKLGLMSHVAQVVGVSRSRLYELFFNEFKSSPKVIWNSMRTEKAMHQIALGDDNMAGIATTLGFSSAGNFSRFFKANTGVSPLAYRKTMVKKKAKKVQIFSIIYTSVATEKLNTPELERILESARGRNQNQHVTGVLLYSEGRFMQYLEGSLPDLYEILGYVKSARQHCNLEIGAMTLIDRRAYKDWSMAFVAPAIFPSEHVALDGTMKNFLNHLRQRA